MSKEGLWCGKVVVREEERTVVWVGLAEASEQNTTLLDVTAKTHTKSREHPCWQAKPGERNRMHEI